MKTTVEPIAERFQRDIAKHKLEIQHDDGLYRHIVMKRPKTGCMMYSLTTTPGRLIYAGDMGCFVFERIPDMFEFFRSDNPDHGPNVGYWHEKLVAIDRDGSMEQSVDKFRENLESYLCDELSEEARKAVTEFIDQAVTEFEDEGPAIAYGSVSDFVIDFDDRNPRQFFGDFLEHSDRIYTLRYVWACYAIRFAIAQYDQEKAAPRTGLLTRPTSADWEAKLKSLVGEVILMQRSGYDVLASAAWDDVERHWVAMENGEPLGVIPRWDVAATDTEHERAEQAEILDAIERM